MPTEATAFWSAKDSITGETAEMLGDGPSFIPCTPKKTGAVQVMIAPGLTVAAETGGALVNRASTAAMARPGSMILVDLRLMELIFVPPCS